MTSVNAPINTLSPQGAQGTNKDLTPASKLSSWGKQPTPYIGSRTIVTTTTPEVRDPYLDQAVKDGLLTKDGANYLPTGDITTTAPNFWDGTRIGAVTKPGTIVPYNQRYYVVGNEQFSYKGKTYNVVTGIEALPGEQVYDGTWTVRWTPPPTPYIKDTYINNYVKMYVCW